LPLALLFLLSCKQAHAWKAPLGPEYSEDQINAVFAQATAAADPSQLKAGQTLHYEEDRRYDNQDPNILMETDALSVIDRTDRKDLNETVITVHHSEQVRNDTSSAFTDIETEDAIEIPDVNVSLAAHLRALTKMRLMSLNSNDSPAPVKITYHNLSSSVGQDDPPSSPAGRSGCGGLSPCKLHVTYISYDEVDWYDDSNYNRFHYDYELTTDLPYMMDLLGTLVSGCVGGNVHLQGYEVYVRDCQVLTDYQK